MSEIVREREALFQSALATLGDNSPPAGGDGRPDDPGELTGAAMGGGGGGGGGPPPPPLLDGGGGGGGPAILPGGGGGGGLGRLFLGGVEDFAGPSLIVPMVRTGLGFDTVGLWFRLSLLAVFFLSMMP